MILAKLIIFFKKEIFKDRFICVSISKNIWYEFRDHRWVENDSGNSLRMAISKELHSVFVKKLGSNSYFFT